MALVKIFISIIQRLNNVMAFVKLFIEGKYLKNIRLRNKYSSTFDREEGTELDLESRQVVYGPENEYNFLYLHPSRVTEQWKD